jgi:Flp pilus assembly pilin Flp
MKNFIKNLINDERGGESIEMALVVASLAVASVASYKSVTSSLDSGLENIVVGIQGGTEG